MNDVNEIEKNNRLLMDHIQAGVALLDSKMQVIAFNRKALDYLGLREEELFGKLATNPERKLLKVDGTELKPHENPFLGLVNGNSTIRNIVIGVCSPNTNDILWTQLTADPIFDGEGNIDKVIVTFIDINARKRTEESLRESEEHYRNIFENAPVGIFHSTLEGKFIDANPTLAKILGYESVKELIESTRNSNVVDVFYVDKEKRDVFVNKVIQTGVWQSFENSYYRKDGRVITGNLVFRTFIQPVSGDRAIEGFIEDITERKQSEQAQLIAERLESLGLLAGGIAHDFNNLLTGIFGYIDLARSVLKDAKANEYLEATLDTMTRAKALTLQLLTFAKGGAPVQKIAVLIPFIQEVVHFALSGSNISCRFNLDENLWPCNIDKNQIGQVINNIVINAQHAMPNGGAIEITARDIFFEEKEHFPLAKGNYVKVSIKDFGIGIPKEIVPRIFDPFFTTKPTGNGLGLATCYSIINRHGGCIDVESEMGKGSTFHIYLPASTEAVVTDSAGEIIKHKGSGTIIFMEDEEVIRISVGNLEWLEYTVVCKKDGREAIDFYKSETKAKRQLTAMIFDLTIPGGMGGIEAVAEIRKLDKTIPVFVASGYADNSVMKNPLRSGFTESISKPFIIAELSQMLNKHLGPPKGSSLKNITVSR